MLSKALILIIGLAGLPFVSHAASSLKADKALTDSTLFYAKAVRWNDFELASESIDPLLANPEGYSEQEEQYYKRFEIVGYTAKYSVRLDVNSYMQRVELRFVDLDSQTEIVKTDRQTWRYDPVAKRWWLTSGLPKLD